MRRWATAAALAAAAAAALPAPAGAHHALLISEVGASGGTTGDFVELQMYRQGQNGISPTQLDVYSPLGVKQALVIGTDPPNGRDQSTILFGATGVSGADFTFAGLGTALDNAGGAVCFAEANPPDCVAWGSFTGAGTLPFPGAGSLAAAIPEGQSLSRSIGRGCPTALESGDDTDSSAADFTIGAPTPRPNSAEPAGVPCVPCEGVNATIVGTDGKDRLLGTDERDVVVAGSGADRILALGGDDLICGGIGKDVLIGKSGRDTLVGGRGRDTCSGGKGRDVLRSCEAGKRD